VVEKVNQTPVERTDEDSSRPNDAVGGISERKRTESLQALGLPPSSLTGAKDEDQEKSDKASWSGGATEGGNESKAEKNGVRKDNPSEEPEQIALPPGWKEFYSREHSRRYFYHAEREEALWTVPKFDSKDKDEKNNKPQGDRSESHKDVRKETIRRRQSLLAIGAPPPRSRSNSKAKTKTKVYRVNKGAAEVKRRRASLASAGAPPGKGICKDDIKGDSKNSKGDSKDESTDISKDRSIGDSEVGSKGSGTDGNADNGNIHSKGGIKGDNGGETITSRVSDSKQTKPTGQANPPNESTRLPPGWEEFYSQEHKRRYYYNSELQKTSWTAPSVNEEKNIKK